MVWRYRPDEPEIKPHPPFQDSWIRNPHTGKPFGRPFFHDEHGSLQRNSRVVQKLPEYRRGDGEWNIGHDTERTFGKVEL
ncbi:hypothetical protein BBO01nite_15970 [Brevibacillus borstelensis]|nr:hypothetical protein BBO01nite_15970 [Brevibacillus borstelensis]